MSFLDDLNAVTVDDLAEAIFEILVAKNKKLAFAESCTGGQLSDVITEIPGISMVYVGGICPYLNAAKIDVLGVPENVISEHSAVSAETAEAMAQAAQKLFSADYAVSTTGYAGPDGGDAKNPVGAVFFGIASPEGVFSKRVVFPGDRSAIKADAVKAALFLLRQRLLEEE